MTRQASAPLLNTYSTFYITICQVAQQRANANRHNKIQGNRGHERVNQGEGEYSTGQLTAGTLPTLLSVQPIWQLVPSHIITGKKSYNIRGNRHKPYRYKITHIQIGNSKQTCHPHT